MNNLTKNNSNPFLKMSKEEFRAFLERAGATCQEINGEGYIEFEDQTVLSSFPISIEVDSEKLIYETMDSSFCLAS